MSRRRSLTDEERALWSGVARSITPLRSSRRAPAPPAVEDISSKASSNPLPVPLVGPEAEPRENKTPALAPLGRRLKQRVARGREPIDARLDLHGYTQSEAHAELLRFLRRAQADGAKIALVVTGKGSRSGEHGAFVECGVLRRQVPLWLSLPEFRSLITGFEGAHASHGGQGALYVRLRRPRREGSR